MGLRFGAAAMGPSAWGLRPQGRWPELKVQGAKVQVAAAEVGMRHKHNYGERRRCKTR